jgi:hypothetical protein
MALDEGFSGLNSLISKDINEIVDLPDFVTPPRGRYKLRMKEIGESKANDKMSLRMVWEVLDTIELNDKEEAVTKPGSLFSESFYFTEKTDIDLTLGILKKKVGHLGANYGTTDLLQILMQMKNGEFTANVTNRKDKDDATIIYPGTREIELAQ